MESNYFFLVETISMYTKIVIATVKIVFTYLKKQVNYFGFKLINQISNVFKAGRLWLKLWLKNIVQNVKLDS